jgi:hypothetical protein
MELLRLELNDPKDTSKGGRLILPALDVATIPADELGKLPEDAREIFASEQTHDLSARAISAILLGTLAVVHRDSAAKQRGES